VKRSTLIEIICYAFFLLFIYASFAKLVIYPTYVRDLGRSPLISDFASVLSVGIPTIELTIATLVLIPKTRRAGLIASFIVMALFSLYVAYILFFAAKRPCSCGGIFRDMGWRTHLIFNLFMTVLAYVGFKLTTKVDRPNHTLRATNPSYKALPD